MATTDGKNAYVNIMELPQISDIDAGDFLIVETPSGTSIIDFEKFLISPANITFNETITTNTTNINVLSSELISTNNEFTALSAELFSELNSFETATNTTLNSISSLNVSTFAVFALTGYNADGVKLLKSSNIASATFMSTLSCVQLQYIRNFKDNQYGFMTGSTTSSFVSVSSPTDITSNYINTYITNASGGFTTALRNTINIIGGTLSE